jgi:hypothetical protein
MVSDNKQQRQTVQISLSNTAQTNFIGLTSVKLPIAL